MSVYVLIDFKQTGELVVDEGRQILSEDWRSDDEGEHQWAHDCSPFEHISGLLNASTVRRASP
jgi:hypothetical protein